MTRVETGVKGDFQANIAPKTPENCPPVPSPNENEFGNITHTQVPHKFHKTSTLVSEVLKIFKNSYVKETAYNAKR